MRYKITDEMGLQPPKVSVLAIISSYLEKKEAGLRRSQTFRRTHGDAVVTGNARTTALFVTMLRSMAGVVPRL